MALLPPVHASMPDPASRRRAAPPAELRGWSMREKKLDAKLRHLGSTVIAMTSVDYANRTPGRARSSARGLSPTMLSSWLSRHAPRPLRQDALDLRQNLLTSAESVDS